MSKKITQLPANTQLNFDDLFEVSHTPSGTPVSQKVKASVIASLQLVAYTGATPVGNSTFNPPDVNQNAIAYSKDGSGALFGWNIDLQTWN